MPKRKSIQVRDERKLSAASGLPVLNGGRTGDYDYEVIANVVKAAQDEGEDPYTALAVALQESGLGSKHQNLGQVEYNRLQKNPVLFAAHERTTAGIKDPLYKSARSLAFMLKNSHQAADKAGFTPDKADEAQRLQAYNGYGKIGANNDIGAKQLYGVDLTRNTIDMRKTPLYGKTILDLRENIIKRNPEIKEIVDANAIPADEFKDMTIVAEPSANGNNRYQFRKNNQVVAQIDGEANPMQTPAAKGAYLRSLYLRAKNAAAAEKPSLAMFSKVMAK